MAVVTTPGPIAAVVSIGGGQPIDLPGHPGRPIAAGWAEGVAAGFRRLEERTVAVVRVRGGEPGQPLGDVVARTVDAAVDSGVPVLIIIDEAKLHPDDSLSVLSGWGGALAAVQRASGHVPLAVVLCGAATGAPALLLGLADVVVVTPDALGWMGGPDAVAAWTGRVVEPSALGGPVPHLELSGVAHLWAADLEDAVAAAVEVLGYLPDNCDSPLPRWTTPDPPTRASSAAAAAVPASSSSAYDVRTLLVDVVDDGQLLELRAGWATNLVTALASIGGRPVGLVANQPAVLAGVLDMAASQKGARFVQWCDAFGLPILSFVDTPGFQPGRDQEWRGMIRKGAQLAFAYAAATTPRICVVVRKAYGGAYIVMDCRTMGSDLVLAWPGAEIAVMGAAGAIEIVGRRELAALDEETATRRRADLEADYRERFLNPGPALRRGLVDAVIDPVDTRAVISAALDGLGEKRERLPRRTHSNGPL